MTRAAWERTITDSAGNVLTGVQIAVFQQDGTTPATIYGQLSGGAALANPFNTGVQTSAKFYADPGRYVIRAVKDGQTKDFTDVDIADKAIRDDVGTAAYLAATTSNADATPGRAVRVGDYGLGVSASLDMRVIPATELAAAVDFNNLVKPGWLKVLANGPIALNAPPATAGGNGFWFLFNIEHIGGTVVQQYAYTYNTPTGAAGSAPTPPQVFTRSRYDGTWTAWAQAQAPAVGQVAFSGSGVNNGAIIESGANASGFYTKFADGTMLAWTDRGGALGVSAYAGIAGLYAGEFIWTYPVAFAFPPKVFGSGADQSRVGWASSYNVDGNRAYLVYFTATAAVSGLSAQMVAIGRWRA